LFVPTTGSPTGNSNCSNGIFEGDITIATASDLERLSGCRRITGNLKVLSPTLKSLEGLEALQQVDGDLDLRVKPLTEGSPPTNPKLESVSGLQGLACVAGNAYIDDDIGLWPDVNALANLVEIGGNLSLNVPAPLVGLRRVFGRTWGNLPAQLPALEVAIGGLARKISVPNARYVGDESGCFYEGVLGCDWTVETQSALDAIADVTLAVNHLGVSGSVSSLAPLQKLVQVGSLRVDAAAVESLEPLRALRRTSKLELANLNVTTVEALEELGPVREVSISAVPKLRTLAGFPSLQANSFYITDAPELESLADLALAHACTNVGIENAPKLANVEALSAIREVRSLTLDNLGIESLRDVSDIHIEFLTVTNNARLEYLGLAGADVYSFTLRSNPALTAPGGLETARFFDLVFADNDAMTTLVGLPPLDDSSFNLSSNDALTTLDGLKGKRTSLTIAANAALESLDGLELEAPANVTIDGNLALQDLSVLSGLGIASFRLSNTPKLEALPAISFGPYGLEINDNAELTRIDALVSTGASWVKVHDNPKLSSLAGVPLTQQLRVENNASLVDLSGLESQTVLDELVIRHNVRLQNLRGLSGVTSVESFLIVSDNDVLPDCEVSWFGARGGQDLPLEVNGPTGPCP